MVITRTVGSRASRRSRLLSVAAMAAASVVALSGCVPGSGSGSDVEQLDGPAELVVWTDSTRQVAFEMYQEAHPEVDLTIEILPDDVNQRLLLANQAGEGWPDIISMNRFQFQAFASSPVDFSANIDRYLPEGFFDEFSDALTSLCQPAEGDVRCLNNDFSPLVLWYDKPLMEEFGYTVPTTWEEFEALGLQLAEEHPGYIISDGGIRLSMFPPARCPIAEQVGDQQIRSDLSDPNCTRVIDMIDNLLEAGAMSPLAGNSPEFTAEFGVERKLLMTVAPVHVGRFRLIDAYGWAEGEIGIAPPLRWEAEDRVYNYAGGGIGYAVSKNSHYQQAATDVITWITTGPYQTDPTTVTYPAYRPAQENWIANNEGAFIPVEGTLTDVLRTAEDTLDDYWYEIPIDGVRNSYDQVVLPQLSQGATVASLIETWQTHIDNEAEAAGWTVTR